MTAVASASSDQLVLSAGQDKTLVLHSLSSSHSLQNTVNLSTKDTAEQVEITCLQMHTYGSKGQCNSFSQSHKTPNLPTACISRCVLVVSCHPKKKAVKVPSSRHPPLSLPVYQGVILRLRFSVMDRAVAASASDSGCVCLWSVESQRLLHKFPSSGTHAMLQSPL